MSHSFAAWYLGERSFLLPGDAEKMSGHAILSNPLSDQLRSEVLTIAHYGSKNSITPDFLAAVQPGLALISSGEQNSYGHPNPQLLERLSGAAVPTLGTSGAIHIASERNVAARKYSRDRRNIAAAIRRNAAGNSQK
jgi:competence protein ComEC